MKNRELFKKPVIVVNFREESQQITEYSKSTVSLKSFIDLLPKELPLTKLYIYNIFINDNLNNLASLIMLIKSCHTLVELKLNNNKFSQSNIILLFETLKSNTSIQTLYINNNNLSDKITPYISKLLKFNKTLFNLNLNNNFIGYNSTNLLRVAPGEVDSVEQLKDALLINKTLGVLSLCSNKLFVNAAIRILEALPINQTLIDLSLDIRASLYSNRCYHNGTVKPPEAYKFSSKATTILTFPLLKPYIWPQTLKNLKEVLETNNKNFYASCTEIDKNTNILPLSFNLKFLYILKLQLIYHINIFNSNVNILEKERYLLVLKKVNLYKLNYPLRVCGITQGYQSKDLSKPFLPYELIVQVFSYLGFNYAAHIDFTHTIPQIQNDSAYHLRKVSLLNDSNLEVNNL